MATEGVWASAFTSKSKGSSSTVERATKTWASIVQFGREKKWDLSPEKITPKQARIFLEARATEITPRCVQLEASHLRRSIAGAGRELGNIRDPQNSWSSARLGVPEGTRIGGKAAADLSKWAEARPKLARDVDAGVGLQLAVGLRLKEAVLAEPSLKGWLRELDKPESRERGCALHVTKGTKGGRPRFTTIRAERVDAVRAAVATAQTVAATQKGKLIDAPDLKAAMKRYSNSLANAGLTGTDSSHGLRRAWAQDQYDGYRSAGLDEKEALRRLSNDLGHGDGRGRWVSNNYLLGGEGGGNGTD